MLRFLSLLGCTKIVQTKCGSVETIENIEPEFGGASRDRTDGLVVANDEGYHLIRLILLGHAGQAGHTVSQTIKLAGVCCLKTISVCSEVVRHAIYESSH